MPAPPLEIHIQGTSQVQLPAERGSLVIAVTSEGTSQTSVSEAVTQASNNLQALFKQLSTKPSQPSNSPNAASQEPPVTKYSMNNLRTRSWQPPDSDSNGEPWARVHEASSHFEATFQDFEKLAEVASFVAYPIIYQPFFCKMKSLFRDRIGRNNQGIGDFSPGILSPSF